LTLESDIVDEGSIKVPRGNYELYVNADRPIDVNIPIYDVSSYKINSIRCKDNQAYIIKEPLSLVIATQNAKQIVNMRGIPPNYEGVIPIQSPNWVVEVQGWSGLRYFLPSQLTWAYRSCCLSPAFENNATRFNYFKEAFYEAVLQREVSKALYKNGNLTLQTMLEAKRLLELIDTLYSHIPQADKLDLLNYLLKSCTF
jgi:hypothetical protein